MTFDWAWGNQFISQTCWRRSNSKHWMLRHYRHSLMMTQTSKQRLLLRVPIQSYLTSLWSSIYEARVVWPQRSSNKWPMIIVLEAPSSRNKAAIRSNLECLTDSTLSQWSTTLRELMKQLPLLQPQCLGTSTISKMPTPLKPQIYMKRSSSGESLISALQAPRSGKQLQP